MRSICKAQVGVGEEEEEVVVAELEDEEEDRRVEGPRMPAW
jgi:hypothetical protein